MPSLTRARLQFLLPLCLLAALVIPLYAGPAGATQATATPIGSAHRAYVVVITNRGSYSSPYTGSGANAAIGSMVDGVLDYWAAQSGGAITSFDRVGKVRRYDTTTVGCETSQILNEAQIKVAPPRSTDHLIVFVPPSVACNSGIPAEGFGTVGSGFGSGGLSVTKLDYFAKPTLSHELGHNFGFDHGNVDRCVVATCLSRISYQNAYEVMAGSSYGSDTPVPSLGAVYRRLNGVDSSTETLPIAFGPAQVALISNQHLAPRVATTGQRALMITDPVDGAIYFVEYRSGTGREADAAYEAGGIPPNPVPDSTFFTVGVTITRCVDHAAVLQMRKDGIAWDGAWHEGQTWTSPTDGVDIEVTEDNAANPANGVDVKVTMDGPVPTPVTPFTPPTPTIISAVKVGYPTISQSQLALDWNRSYRWLVNGVPVAGSGGTTFTPTAAMLGKSLRVEITGHRCGYADTTALSAPKTIKLGSFVTKKPTITGTVKVGKTLTAHRGSWSPTPATTKYQWFANGNKIGGATKAKVTLKAAQKGKTITVKVTGKRTGYAPASATSKKTAKVTG